MAEVIALNTMEISDESELKCVGRMQVQRTLNHDSDEQLGFICGSLPVPTASLPKAFTSTAVVYQNKRVIAPQYRLLPAETDLNAPVDNALDITPVQEPGELCETVARKCDTLAASALSGHGDGIDVIAPVEILKQIFKAPYSKARVSVAVHRIGRTLILNSGPDEETETLARRKKHNSKLGEKMLYSRFIHESMKSPSTSAVTAEDKDLCATLPLPSKDDGKLSWAGTDCGSQSDSQQEDEDGEYMDEESEGTQKRNSDGFLRVLFWQFQNLRMLVGSDLLVFSNDKHVAVSLHLVELKRQVTPLMWLDAWLDNVMASVPELAICYHENGVVHGYELLKTDDIYSLKGISKDGKVFFQPHVVQQNALSVLRFLQENCKHDPGTYWLFKNTGEDVLQLFDLTKSKKNENRSTLPSRSSSTGTCYTLPLAMLLYRIAYSLSRSQESSDICKCAKLFRKCLEFLDNEDHLIIKAITHEQVARLILNCCKEHGSSTKPMLLLEAYEEREDSVKDSVCIEELSVNGDSNNSDSVKELAVCSVTECSSESVDTEPDPVSARLAAVHHVSEAILSLRCQRQLQDGERKHPKATKQFPLCLCGDIDCVSFYDIGSSEFGALMDHKLRELILMLGESYLALGEAYCEKGDLSRTVKAAQLGCSVYASVLQYSSGRLRATPYGCQYCLPSKTLGKKLVKPGKTDLQKGLFWGQVWRLIGDIYIKNLMLLSESSSLTTEGGELQMAEEIVREVKRLRKKSGEKPGCGVCSESDCTCHMDRANSSSSATSSSGYDASTSSRTSSKHKKGGKAGDQDEKHESRKGSKNKKVNKIITTQEGDDERSEGYKQGSKSKTAIINEENAHEESYRQVCRNHVCFHLQRVLTKDLKTNFLAAVDCYDASIYALTDVHGASPKEKQQICYELEAAIRKKGWACNELARLILASEDLNLAETAYKTAIRAFEAVGDSTNVVLINCNLGHALRSSAEKLVAWISVSRFDLSDKYILEAKGLYERALTCYRAAKAEVGNLSNSDLEEEVTTQLANTHLRLGLFAVNQQTLAAINNSNECPLTSYRLQALFTANSPILEALVLYESANRAQEAAFAHYQIGCHLEKCLSILKGRAEEYATTEYAKDNNLKLYVSIADHHLRKALQYYHPDAHPSMFLDIMQKECALCFLSLSFLSSYQEEQLVIDQGVSFMLQGWRAFDGTLTPSEEALTEFLKTLQTVLKNVLHMAMNNTHTERGGVRVSDVCRLKDIYRVALRSTVESLPRDLRDLYALWTTQESS